MRIVIDHLTRMSRPYVCVAGLLEDGSAHVRPVAGHLPRELVASFGGPFDLGALVDLGPVEPSPTCPEIEDHRFEPKKVRRIEYVPPDALWTLLKGASKRTLSEIFGADLTFENTWRGGAAAVPRGKGACSLGLLRPTGRVVLQVQDSYDGKKKELRAVVTDKLGVLNLSVTDLRFYDDAYEVNQTLVKTIQAKLEREKELLLAIGLTREFARRGDAPRHWLQVNNLYLSSDPGWRLA